MPYLYNSLLRGQVPNCNQDIETWIHNNVTDNRWPIVCMFIGHVHSWCTYRWSMRILRWDRYFWQKENRMVKLDVLIGLVHDSLGNMMTCVITTLSQYAIPTVDDHTKRKRLLMCDCNNVTPTRSVILFIHNIIIQKILYFDMNLSSRLITSRDNITNAN